MSKTEIFVSHLGNRFALVPSFVNNVTTAFRADVCVNIVHSGDILVAEVSCWLVVGQGYPVPIRLAVSENMETVHRDGVRNVVIYDKPRHLVETLGILASVMAEELHQLFGEEKRVPVVVAISGDEDAQVRENLVSELIGPGSVPFGSYRDEVA